MAAFLVFVMSAMAFILLFYKYAESMNSITRNFVARKEHRMMSKKWIVVTSANYPTEDLMSLARIPGWKMVVVGDTKTPKNWRLEGVHFLSVEDQQLLDYSLSSDLPYNSYTRKNIGYLYAIQQGAGWIYDTDDDNKPFALTLKRLCGRLVRLRLSDKRTSRRDRQHTFSREEVPPPVTFPFFGLGLQQFDYTEHVSGLRCGHEDQIKRHMRPKLFDPYQFFGGPHMWLTSLPTAHQQNYTNATDQMYLCHKMRSAAVQQGLVYNDHDVEEVFRMLLADNKTELNEKLNRITPPVVLEAGQLICCLLEIKLHMNLSNITLQDVRRIWYIANK
ncbi:hypothetical protein ANCCAN_05689 [Ancylostoma caninum]|uniref:Core-2/I-Branching enzyme n=1 Tax=Ancylostoma caninum TaxID=29170 RepID=A0A368GVC3_ANCCA|nr:hypothetical protein ANCCAN_05689 [Ancylostoma caninum]